MTPTVLWIGRKIEGKVTKDRYLILTENKHLIKKDMIFDILMNKLL